MLVKLELLEGLSGTCIFFKQILVILIKNQISVVLSKALNNIRLRKAVNNWYNYSKYDIKPL